MNDHDLGRDFEEEVRAGLRHSIVPPPTPEYLRDHVERLAAREIADPGYRGPFRSWWRRRSLLGGLAATAALIAIIAATAFWRGAGWSAGPASSGSSGPTFAPGPVLHMSVTADGGGFVYTDGDGLRVTTDRGVTWSEARQVPARDSAQDHLWDLTSLDFVDAQHGWITGVKNASQGSQVVVYRTRDGGRTWQSAPVTPLLPEPSPAQGSFVAAEDHFWDALHGRVVVGRVVPNDGEMAGCQWYATDDGGVTWSGPTSGPCIGLSPMVRWTTDAIGYFVPTDAPTSVSVTQDGGRTWRTAPLPGLSVGTILPELLVVDGIGHLSLVTSVSPSDGPAPQLVFGSSDGGVTWSKEFDMTLPAGFDTVDSVSALGPQHWIVVVEVAPGPPMTGTPQAQYGYARFAETVDGGRTWSLMDGGGVQGAGGSLWWDDRRGMTAAGDPTKILVTDDGGRTWHQVPF